MTEATIKLEEGRKLTKDEGLAIVAELEKVRADVQALRDVSEDKDEVIQEQARAIKRLGKEQGTKLFVLGGLSLGADSGSLRYGLGADVGARWGNSLLTSFGVTYDIGSFDGAYGFDADRWSFNVKCGWMF